MLSFVCYYVGLTTGFVREECSLYTSRLVDIFDYRVKCGVTKLYSFSGLWWWMRRMHTVEYLAATLLSY